MAEPNIQEVLSLADLLNRGERYIEVPGYKPVKIRDLGVKERMDAEAEARKHPAWKDMDILERRTEINRRVAIKMILEPRMDDPNYLNANAMLMDIVIAMILRDNEERYRRLVEKGGEALRSFLAPQMGGDQESSTGS